MLDLSTGARAVEGLELAADDREPRVFHVLPPGPQVARVNGRPDLELLRFVRDGALTGGHLRLSTELAHAPARLEAARAALVEELRHDDVRLCPLAVTAASAELAFVGRETDADGGLSPLLRRSYGRVVPGLEGRHQANFAVPLSPDGVRLMEAALRSGGAPIVITYRLEVEGLWPAQRVVAHVDWSRVYDHFSRHVREGALLAVADIQRLSEELVENRAVRIEAVQGLTGEAGGAGADLAPALAFLQRELVERFCEPVLPLSREPAHASLGAAGEFFGVGASFAAKRLIQIERATAEMDFQRTLVVSRTLTVQALLADLLGGEPADAFLAEAGLDHPFFQRLVVRVGSARPLASVQARELVVHFSYGSTQAALRLTPESPEATAEAWVDAAPERTWTLRPELTFAADAPLDAGRLVPLPPLEGQSRDVTLDLEALLGLRRVEVWGTPDPRVLLTRATLTHLRGSERVAERQLTLSTPAPQTAVFRDVRESDRIELAVRHFLKDGRMLDGGTLTVDTRVVRLPAPVPAAQTVQLVADDDWSDLDRVVVALQKSEGGATGVFVFDGPGQLKAVSLDLPDPTDRHYRYRATRTWSSGTVEEDDWIPSDAALLVVGRTAANKLVVDVTPVGLELPEAGVVLIEVELSYVDAANQVRDVGTRALIRARADRFRWQVGIRDPTHRNYEYRVTTHRTSGDPLVGHWIASTDRILLIPVSRP